MRWLGGAPAVVVLAAGLLLAAPGWARADEQIRAYSVQLRIEPSGELLVSERISYDFGPAQRHGILRDLPVRRRFDSRRDRLYPVRVVGVRSPDAPDQYSLEDADGEEGPLLRIRIGDPNQTVTGRHDYTIDYRVQGALDGFADHDELYWNVVGSLWKVPIGEASATVTAPAAITHVACHAGPSGAGRPCGSSLVDGRTASFAVGDLGPFEGLAVGVGFPTGVVPAPHPMLQERWSLARAFAATPASMGMAGASAVLLVVGWLVAVGRNRRVVAGSGAGGAAAQPAVTASRSRAGGMLRLEAAPPDGLRPAQAGLLLDKVVTPVAVTATLVDLAVRGYLRIEERPGRGHQPRDWQLVQLQPHGDLVGYERALLEELFGMGSSHRLSELHQQFHSRFERIRSVLSEEAVQRGWFTARPDQVQAIWARRGAALAVVGAVLLGLAIWRARLALVPIPIVFGGLLLWWGARRMPRRTPTGTELARRVAGFRTYLQSLGADIRGATAVEGVLSRELPYAIVFGRTRRWVRARPQLGLGFRPSWYLGDQPQPVSWLVGLIDQFARSSAMLLVARPTDTGWRRPLHDLSRGGWSWGGGHDSSGGGGFSGGGSSDGGGGGGGGDSW
ncbi:MAG TPA: DUF2207 domain-containing protein [Actinomycetes bacterium]|nr:DUF2207 domain-containing protein [Actinomycetes bacterium]